MKAVLKAFLLLVALVIVVAGVAILWIGSRGISARAEPGTIETTVARTMRRLAIPRTDRNRPNPVELTPEALASGMEHFADHCAVCHANDGSGDTEMGRGLYPKAPDMRLAATQSLSDGELFYIIEHGIRLTGMPAWGTGKPEEAEDTWHLVHFVRHLVRISGSEIEKMKELNPAPPHEIRQKDEEERFLKGETAAPPPAHTGHN